MPKRKREQTCPVQNYGESRSIPETPACLPSSRKSARLQERRDRSAKQTQQHNELPAPSPDQSFDRLPHRRTQQPRIYALTDGPPRNFQPDENKPERQSARKDHYDPIQHWRDTSNWPSDFAKRGFDMSDSKGSTSSNKRLRTSSSYNQNVKEGEVPEQYTPAYEMWILTKGLDMHLTKGKELVSQKSEDTCIDLQKIIHLNIEPITYPNEAVRELLDSYRYRNEAILMRDVTPMIVPPVLALYYRGSKHLEHVVDEVSADWPSNYILAGPRPRPDLAIGLRESAFTSEEMDKLKSYAATDNWTRFTGEMYFPFLLAEVTCGRDGLDVADRQNMHSSSVAVKAILRIEQEADKFRSEQKVAEMNGEILVYSISHDQRDARLYGHFATIRDEK